MRTAMLVLGNTSELKNFHPAYLLDEGTFVALLNIKTEDNEEFVSRWAEKLHSLSCEYGLENSSGEPVVLIKDTSESHLRLHIRLLMMAAERRNK